MDVGGSPSYIWITLQMLFRRISWISRANSMSPCTTRLSWPFTQVRARRYVYICIGTTGKRSHYTPYLATADRHPVPRSSRFMDASTWYSRTLLFPTGQGTFMANKLCGYLILYWSSLDSTSDYRSSRNSLPRGGNLYRMGSDKVRVYPVTWRADPQFMSRYTELCCWHHG